ncbi:hypothetical protein [Aeromicrobium ginsengisoli]|uniref:Uncharacterized protein n=1 Tax=Aeromicrobium ginsengisoli TaxID=363867 RepID=A0A5M4FC15_9ACTN|nr:hypothetical protein [Aeromicrobium ginsengisoli]KAA1395821.1 hypothetical protein ESP70_016935 [Aeromicrobium ginsengisoli]
MTRLGWFFRDASGRLVVVQLPNTALVVWLAATVLRWSAYDSRDTELRWIGAGALIVWALDELVRGASPFRRLLGAVVLAWQLANVF